VVRGLLFLIEIKREIPSISSFAEIGRIRIADKAQGDKHCGDHNCERFMVSFTDKKVAVVLNFADSKRIWMAAWAG